MFIHWTLVILFLSITVLMMIQSSMLSRTIGNHLYLTISLYGRKPCRRKFRAEWFNRFTLPCYSRLYDGAFCLGCVLFGKEMGHNGTKLSNLFKDPLVNWQTATQRFEYHEKTFLVHHDSMLRLAQFDDVIVVLYGEYTGNAVF